MAICVCEVLRESPFRCDVCEFFCWFLVPFLHEDWFSANIWLLFFSGRFRRRTWSWFSSTFRSFISHFRFNLFPIYRSHWWLIIINFHSSLPRLLNNDLLVAEITIIDKLLEFTDIYIFPRLEYHLLCRTSAIRTTVLLVCLFAGCHILTAALCLFLEKAIHDWHLFHVWNALNLYNQSAYTITKKWRGLCYLENIMIFLE